MTPCPFTILVDAREKLPYSFHGIGDLTVTTRWGGHLLSGDYTLEGDDPTTGVPYSQLISIERKSLADLFSTLGGNQGNRERFEAEHDRLGQLAVAAVVIEADWWTILNMPPDNSQLNPEAIFGTAVAWSAKYGVPWVPCGTREIAERYTFKMLEQFWKRSVRE